MEIFDSGTNSCEEIMRLDFELLETLESRSDPLLHLYDWKGPSATYGYFTKPEVLINLQACQQEGLSLAKRPTGGGIIFHLTDLAFSFFLPSKHPQFKENTLDNYALVNQRVIEALSNFSNTDLVASLLPTNPTPLDASCSSFCMAKPTIYDVVHSGKKVGGAAQRRTRHGLLHQGSISLAPPPLELLEKILLPQTRVLEGMKLFSYSLVDDVNLLTTTRQKLKMALIETFSKFC